LYLLQQFVYRNSGGLSAGRIFQVAEEICKNSVVCIVSKIELENDSLFIYLLCIIRRIFSAYVKDESSIRFILLFAELTSGTERGTRKGMINIRAQEGNKYVSFN
jgi:hypothetical protein